jgi:hypothetical protein
MTLSLAAATALYAQAELTVPAGLPDWAFNIPDQVQPSAVRVEGTIKAPGSAKDYDAKKIAGNATPPDWFPDEHPPAPKVVAGGDGVRFACGSCHLMSGQGHPEAADLAGQPAAYLVRQMAYYKSGARLEEARMGPIAKTTSDEDVRQAADYFAALKPRAWVIRIRVSSPMCRPAASPRAKRWCSKDAAPPVTARACTARGKCRGSRGCSRSSSPGSFSTSVSVRAPATELRR